MFVKINAKNEGDEIWWIEDLECIDRFLFSFDKIKIFNIYKDYPHNLSI